MQKPKRVRDEIRASERRIVRATECEMCIRDSEYSVPYAYGIVGVIYDANVVDEGDAGDWDLMWNDKYSGSILQFNNSRDAFGLSLIHI